MLQPGEYNFPFQFHTPAQNLPTSVEGNFGHVRYWLKASIDRPWRFDITTKSVFTVIEYVDINADEELLVSDSIMSENHHTPTLIPHMHMHFSFLISFAMINSA